MADNPVYELLVESLLCADRLLESAPDDLPDAIHRVERLIALPGWLPQFTALIAAMRVKKGGVF